MHDGRPWGLNGPEFLVVYAAALAVVCCVVAFVRKRVRSRGVTGGDHGALGVYDRAYLRGGTARVADTALAGLVEARAVRVDRRRRITATGPKGKDGFQHLVLERVGSGTKVPALRKEIRDSGRCGPIARGLQERGLVVAGSGRRVLLAVLALYPLLIAVGVARAVNGAAQHYAIGFLIWEILIALMAWRVAATSCEHPLSTTAGDVVKRRDLLGRSAHRRTPASAGLGAPDPGTPPEDAASRVAARGLGAYPDTQLARLLEPPRSSGAGGGAAGGAGGAGGGGGGGCGGGGG